MEIISVASRQKFLTPCLCCGALIDFKYTEVNLVDERILRPLFQFTCPSCHARVIPEEVHCLISHGGHIYCVKLEDYEPGEIVEVAFNTHNLIAGVRLQIVKYIGINHRGSPEYVCRAMNNYDRILVQCEMLKKIK